MTLPTKTFQQCVDEMILMWASELYISPVIKSGDPLLAAFQAVAGQIQFLQGLSQLINLLSRASTSTGIDLDSWMADFGFTRTPATYASGAVTFSTLSAHASAVTIPVGTTVQTIGGSIQYTVVADTTQPRFDPLTNAYVLQAAQTSVNASVVAVVSGSTSNVQPNQLVQLFTPIPGIDLITNNLAITNGVAAMSDADFRAAFVAYLSTLARGTKAAILAAINKVQAGLYVNLLENERSDFSEQLGFFTALIDDGSGSPPQSLLDNVGLAIEAVRAFTVQYNVAAPTIINVTVGVVVHIDSSYNAASVQLAAQSAIVSLVNGKSIAETLYISDIEQAALQVSGVLSVQSGSTTINSGVVDLATAANKVVRTTSGSVTVGVY